LIAVELPLQTGKSCDGIISYLTGKHGRNLHERGIVTVTSIVFDPALGSDVGNVLDSNPFNAFSMMLERHAVCLDFHEMRIRLTHVTLMCYSERGWLLMGSEDGVNWTYLIGQGSMLTGAKTIRVVSGGVHFL
jgi:hypothetical protein